ncbi:VOC family protein [Myxococcota bacterium]|nr:VOC family protein [Myxococcota bacterium]
MKRTEIVELDHFGVNVRSLLKARRFYEAALGALGMKINMDVGDAFGMGSKKQLVFWVVKSRTAASPIHFAFRVQHRGEVHAFYDNALRAGGTDNGPPGPRPNYGPDYYAAFVHDPEGNNVEVVCYSAGAAPEAPAIAVKKGPARRKVVEGAPRGAVKKKVGPKKKRAAK